MSKSADFLDGVSDDEERFRDMAIRVIQSNLQVPKDFDGKHCVRCDDKIPKARLDLGMFRCIECQTLLERRLKG